MGLAHGQSTAAVAPSFELLAFGEHFNQPVAALRLPPSLRYLSFGARFNHPLHELLLPSGLHTFAIRRASAAHDLPSSFHRPPHELPLLPASLRLLQAPKFLLDRSFVHIRLPRNCAVQACT